MSERKQRRIQWWKQHGKQVEPDDTDVTSKKSCKESAMMTITSPQCSFSPKPFMEKRSKQNLVAKSKEDKTSLDKKDRADDKKRRYVLFIGNMPFDLKKEDILEHFRCTGGASDLRLMTKKETGTSKGCGFLEFEDSVSYTKALNLHHSTLGGRKINVEVTCGGGGSSEKRKSKLIEKKKSFKRKRARKHKPSEISDAKSDKKSNEKMGGGEGTEETADDTNTTKEQRKITTGQIHGNEEELVKHPKKKTKLQEAGAMISVVKELGLGELVDKRIEEQAAQECDKQTGCATSTEKKKKKRNKPKASDDD